MDFGNIHDLALQLRTPQGAAGEEVGKVMAQFNAEAIAWTLEQLEVKPADRILEIGFGPGEAIAALVPLIPHGFIAGIDHSETMLTMAMERNADAIAKGHVALRLGKADALPYENNSFDKIFAVNVFHFWPDPSRELAECVRVLKPGGRVLFYITHPSSWLKGLQETGVFIAREPEDVEKIFRDVGLRNVTSKTLLFKDEGKGFV